MSWEAQLAVIQAGREPGRLNDAEFRVLMNLAEHHNGQTGRCDPSRELLANEADKDRGYLRRILRALEDRGEIARVDPSSKGGKGHRQQYRLLLKGDWGSPFGAGERGTGSTTKGDSGHHQRGTTHRADLRRREQPGIEPGKNQRDRSRARPTPDGADRARSDPDQCSHEVGEPCRNLCHHSACARDCGTCNDPRRLTA